MHAWFEVFTCNSSKVILKHMVKFVHAKTETRKSTARPVLCRSITRDFFPSQAWLKFKTTPSVHGNGPLA